jgi:hypothetical protein
MFFAIELIERQFAGDFHIGSKRIIQELLKYVAIALCDTVAKRMSGPFTSVRIIGSSHRILNSADTAISIQKEIAAI